jgi:integrase
LSDSVQLKQMLPGVHRVSRKRPDGQATEYWYAWRGGPQILKVGPLPARQLRLALAKATPDASARFAALTAAPKDNVTLYGLITRYLEPTKAEPGLPPLHLRGKSPRTLKDRRAYLDFIRNDPVMSQMEIAALEAKGARKILLDWRAEMASTPKSADERLYALSCVLSWATDRGELTRNPVKDFDRIYSVDRSEIIWEPHHLDCLLSESEPEFAAFVQVSAMTGIRLGDLRRLPRSAVGKDAIIFQSGKSNKKRTVVVPIFDEVRPVLDAIKPSAKSLTLLNSSRGRPWSESGIESALRRARLETTKDGVSPIKGLRIHDLRGTAATNFMRWGMDDQQIATLMGWKLEQVSEIRRRYVSGEEIGLAMVRRIRENKARASSVNAIVK